MGSPLPRELTCLVPLCLHNLTHCLILPTDTASLCLSESLGSLPLILLSQEKVVPKVLRAARPENQGTSPAHLIAGYCPSPSVPN